MPDVDVEADVEVDAEGDGDGEAAAATAGIRSSDIAAPTTATHRRIVRTSVLLTRRMSPLPSNRFSRRLHNPTSGKG